MPAGYRTVGILFSALFALASMNAPLIVIAGPTGSGKSGLAVDLALAFDGEVVNCDSVQVYRHLNIGAAKLPEPERHGVPHHLIDLVEPDQVFTAGEYLRVGRTVLNQIRERRRIPIVAGGTGLYLRALLEGLFEGPQRSDSLRARLGHRAKQKGSTYLHRLLSRIDPSSATSISPNDKPKMIRALEVYFLTSVPISRHFMRGRDPLQGYKVLQIGLNPPRQRLYEFIDQRVTEMFATGLVAEVQGLCSTFGSDLRPLQSLGYVQTVSHLRGEITLTEAVDLTQRQTRQYAKRQLTWFRRDKNIHWLEGFGSEPLIRGEARDLVAKFLAGFQISSN
jgi:tRNA dimethylallyltransferase